MPIPANIYALSTTPASNSPGGGENAILADDYLREWAAYIALLRDVVLSGTSSLTTLNLAYTGTLTGGTGIVNLGAGQFYKDATGNVGIGTNAPISPLQIRSDSATDLTIIRANNNTSSAVVGSGLHLGYSAADFYGYRLTNHNNPGATAAGLFKLQRGTTTSWVDVLVSDNSGNVGIGVAAPSAKLEVSGQAKVGTGAATNSTTLLVNTVSGSAAGVQLFQDGIESWVMQVPASSTALTFGNSGAERMRIDGAGNVGIGTAAPEFKLHVAASAGTVASFGEASSGAAIDIANRMSAWPVNTRAAIGWAESTFPGTPGAGSLVLASRGNSASSMLFGTTGAERMRIDSAGKVGIGTASPTAQLDIASNILRLRTAKTPSSAADTGNTGDMCWDATYLYICIAGNTWRRILHATW